MRRSFALAILLGALLAAGCLNKQKRRAPLVIDRPVPPLPSALEKGQPPTPPVPLVENTLPDTTDYKSVAIPPAPRPLMELPATIPVSATIPDPGAADDEKKRLLDRIREKREKEKEPAKEKPMLPSAIAPNPATRTRRNRNCVSASQNELGLGSTFNSGGFPFEGVACFCGGVVSIVKRMSPA